MSLEKQSIQFNKEKFASELTESLQRYFNNIMELEILDINDPSNKQQEETLKKIEEQELIQIVGHSATALKSSENKQEILNIIEQIVYDLNRKKQSVVFDQEIIHVSYLFEKIILELLK